MKKKENRNCEQAPYSFLLSYKTSISSASEFTQHILAYHFKVQTKSSLFYQYAKQKWAQVGNGGRTLGHLSLPHLPATT